MTNEFPYHAISKGFNIILNRVANIENSISFAALFDTPIRLSRVTSISF